MNRLLQALRVGNFKAFADTQRIPLKPITLIFGPNSAGKSSFIHSLALAHEAQFGREKRSLSRLDVHHTDVGGSAIDLGGFRQYVHRGQLNRRVEWGAELKVSALSQGKDQRLAQLLAPVSSVAVITNCPCWAATSPAGLSTTALLQPVNRAAKAAGASQHGLRVSLIFNMLRARQRRV